MAPDIGVVEGMEIMTTFEKQRSARYIECSLDVIFNAEKSRAIDSSDVSADINRMIVDKRGVVNLLGVSDGRLKRYIQDRTVPVLYRHINAGEAMVLTEAEMACLILFVMSCCTGANSGSKRMLGIALLAMQIIRRRHE